MLTINKGSVRESSFQELFDAFLKYGTLSRAQIESASGLSSVTVSRTLDPLLDAGILIQLKNPEYVDNSSHKSEVFSIAKYAEFNMIDLSDGGFAFYEFSTNHPPKLLLSRQIGNEFGFEEEFSMFLSTVKSRNIGMKDSCVLIFPIKNADNFNISGKVFPTIPDKTVIPELFAGIFDNVKLFRISRENALKNGAITDRRNSGRGNASYICVDNLFCTFSVLGENVVTQPFDGFGAGFIRGNDGRSVLRKLAESNSTDDLPEILSDISANLLATVSPQKIIVSSGRFKLNPMIAQDIKTILCEQADPCFGLTYGSLPEIFVYNKSLHLQGAAKMMIKHNFERLLKISSPGK